MNEAELLLREIADLRRSKGELLIRLVEVDTQETIKLNQLALLLQSGHVRVGPVAAGNIDQLTWFMSSLRRLLC